jgi:hypothetical protein
MRIEQQDEGRAADDLLNREPLCTVTDTGCSGGITFV